MKVLVPLANGFEEIEAVSVIDVLRRAGIEVVTAGLPGTIVEGSRNVKMIADRKIDDVKKEDFDAVVLPGGDPGYVNLSKSKKLTDILTDFNENNKTIAAICASPSILGKLGILDGKKATIYPGMEKDIPKPRDGKVVVDGNVITSQGPGTAIDFALEIISRAKGKFFAQDIREQLVY